MAYITLTIHGVIFWQINDFLVSSWVEQDSKTVWKLIKKDKKIFKKGKKWLKDLTSASSINCWAIVFAEKIEKPWKCQLKLIM